MRRVRMTAVLACVALSACSAVKPTATPSDRLAVQVETVEMLMLESYPV